MTIESAGCPHRHIPQRRKSLCRRCPHGIGHGSLSLERGKHRVRLYAGHSSGRCPGPLCGRQPKGRERKIGSIHHRKCNAVDKEAAVFWWAKKLPPVWPCEPLCAPFGTGQRSLPLREFQADLGRCPAAAEGRLLGISAAT